MAIFSKKRGDIQELVSRTRELEKAVAGYRDVQELLVKDILSLQEATASYKGNDYQDYATAVEAISNKYTSASDWGAIQTRAVIDLRAAFILGDGVKVVSATGQTSDAQRELDWANSFFEYNSLDYEMSVAIAKEAEIEGKIAIKLAYDDEPFQEWPGMVTVRFMSWYLKRYEVKAHPNDYLWYKTLSWNPTSQTAAEKLEEAEFVYKKFGGRIYNTNEAQPKIMACLTVIDRLDRALRDLRDINHKYAACTPDFKVDTEKEVADMLARIERVNWKIGKAFVHTGTYSLVGPDTSGVANLIAEIEMCVKMISGVMGIPIHFLGLLDLLRNRATGDNTRELVLAATSQERAIWRGAYQEMLEKAMAMFNEKAYAQKSREARLDPSKVRADILTNTQEHWDRIERVLIPAASAGIVSKEYVASQIPGVDLEAEAERREENDARDLERAQMELETLKEESRAGQDDGSQEAFA